MFLTSTKWIITFLDEKKNYEKKNYKQNTAILIRWTMWHLPVRKIIFSPCGEIIINHNIEKKFAQKSTLTTLQNVYVEHDEISRILLDDSSIQLIVCRAAKFFFYLLINEMNSLVSCEKEYKEYKINEIVAG